MLKALLFDLDGTLSDTDPIHYETWREIMAGYGLQIDPTFYKTRFSGRLNQQIVEDLLPQLSPAEGEALSNYKEALFRERAIGQLKPTPGLADILDWVEAHGLKKAVVTNAPAENARFMLQVLNLESVFPIVILGNDLPFGKPDPLPYRIALERLNVAPTESLAFEDSPSGLCSAVGAGIPTVAIASTQSPEMLTQLGATLVVSDFTDLRLKTLLKSSCTTFRSLLTE